MYCLYFYQSYPINCETDENVKCIRGKNAAFYRLVLGIFPPSISMLAILISMTLLYLLVRRQEKEASKYLSSKSLQKQKKRSRVVFNKAVLFIGSYTCIWMPFVITSIVNKKSGGNFALFLFVCIFIPLQGFFNAIIYLYDRMKFVEHLKRASELIKKRASSMFEKHRSSRSFIMKAIEEAKVFDDELQNSSDQEVCSHCDDKISNDVITVSTGSSSLILNAVVVEDVDLEKNVDKTIPSISS